MKTDVFTDQTYHVMIRIRMNLIPLWFPLLHSSPISWIWSSIFITIHWIITPHPFYPLCFPMIIRILKIVTLSLNITSIHCIIYFIISFIMNMQILKLYVPFWLFIRIEFFLFVPILSYFYSISFHSAIFHLWKDDGFIISKRYFFLCHSRSIPRLFLVFVVSYPLSGIMYLLMMWIEWIDDSIQSMIHQSLSIYIFVQSFYIFILLHSIQESSRMLVWSMNHSE